MWERDIEEEKDGEEEEGWEEEKDEGFCESVRMCINVCVSAESPQQILTETELRLD